MEYKEYQRIGESIISDVLENGLAVFIVKKPGYSKKYAYFATNYGGADRRFKYNGSWIDTPMGVAHFLEHKMFDMPEENALNTLSKLGASPNAYTSHDITAYHFECVDNFYDSLRILLQFVSTPYFTAESVKKEQGIIGQEIVMTLDNPSSELYYGLMRCLYENNPVRERIVGSVESIAEITPNTLNTCHKVFYNPSNMVLCVVGDVDENEVLRIAAEIVTANAGELPERDYGVEYGSGPFSKKTEKTMQVASPLFFTGSRVDVPDGGKEYLRKITVGQLSTSLFLGESSPLYAKLYAEGLVMEDFIAEFDVVADTASIIFGGEARDVDKVLDEIRMESMRTAAEGFSNDYFERVKLAFVGAELRALNNFDNICYNVSKGYFKRYDPFISIETIESITQDEVREFISEYINSDRFAVSVINPTVK